MFKLKLSKKSLFILLYLLLILIWIDLSKEDRNLINLGSNIFSIGAYGVALYWMLGTFRSLKDKQKYFWLIFSMGIFSLFLSKIVPLSFYLKNGFYPHSPLEDYIRLIGYFFFFIGFVYQMKLLRSTLQMLQYMINIITVIITVNSLSWYFLVNPFLERNQELPHSAFFLSSIYHVLNISLVFAAGWLLLAIKNKTGLNFIMLGFFIQVIGDFFYINQLQHLGVWLVFLWPISTLIMGVGANYTKDHPWILKDIEKIAYNQNIFSWVSTAVLLGFTIFDESNKLLIGFYLTIMLLLVQQVLTAVENRQTFSKLKQLAYASGDFHKGKPSKDRNYNRIDILLKRIDELAHYDSLTQLPNRNLFQKNVEQMLEYETKFSILYIDIDRFKYVNDSLGHDSGDLLLKEVANRVKTAVNDTDVVARIGGDEFAIIVGQSESEQLRKMASRILQAFEKPFHIKGHKLFTTPSIGISIFPEQGQSMNVLLKNADAAMYKAKEEGKNRYVFFDEQLHEKLSKRLMVEERLRRAIEEDALSLYYQPQVDLETEKVLGFEALLRWNDKHLGTVSPVEFIPIAEETGLIDQIGNWVLITACQQLKDWEQIGLTDVTVAVNVSLRQFQNPHFIAEVKEVLQETELSPDLLKIEITESTLQDLDMARDVLEELQSLGIQIAIDDFGTGYSSLSYLKNLPVNYLKIDKSFMEELSVNTISPIVKTIISMGRNMNFSVIAEGIETADHVNFLRENKCHVGQGYLFSRPLPASDIENYFQDKLQTVSYSF